jgi:hypothetical protein
MAAHKDFCKIMKQDIDVKLLWDHLDTLYDMKKLV